MNYPARRSAHIPRRKAAAGFTLIEIMVVVVIIGILGAFIVPNIMGRQEQAQVTAARSDLRTIGAALDLYKLDNFAYPSTEQGLEALVQKPGGFPEPKNWNPQGYLKSVRSDPWGNAYQYLSTGNGFQLYSLGADGQEGGEGYAADLRYSEI